MKRLHPVEPEASKVTDINDLLTGTRHHSSGAFSLHTQMAASKVAVFLLEHPALHLIRWTQGAIALGAVKIQMQFKRCQILASADVDYVGSELIQEKVRAHWDMALLLAAGVASGVELRYGERIIRTSPDLQLQQSTRPSQANCQLLLDFPAAWFGLKYAYSVAELQQDLRQVFACWPGELLIDARRIAPASAESVLRTQRTFPWHAVEELELGQGPGAFRYSHPEKQWSYNWSLDHRLTFSPLGGLPKGQFRSLWVSLLSPDGSLKPGAPSDLKIGTFQELKELEKLPETIPPEYDEDREWIQPGQLHCRELPLHIDGFLGGQWLVRACRAIEVTQNEPRGQMFFIKDGALLTGLSLPVQGHWSFWTILPDEEVPVDASGLRVVVNADVQRKLVAEIEHVNQLARRLAGWEKARKDAREALWVQQETILKQSGSRVILRETPEQLQPGPLLPLGLLTPPA